MNYCETLKLYKEVIFRRLSKLKQRYLPSIKQCFCNGNNLDRTKILYNESIKDALTNYDDVSNKMDETIGKIIKYVKTELKDEPALTIETKQKIIFEQICDVVKYIHSFLISNYIFNTISNNNLRDYSKESFGKKINDIILTKNGKKDFNNSGCNCGHFILLFKHFFDELNDA